MEGAPDLLRYRSPAGRWALAAAVLGSGVAFLDSTVVNVALSDIGDDFDVGLTAFQWVVNAYLVALGALVLLGGSLGDLFGKRRVYAVGVTWFGLASVACGLAPSIETLIAARAVQGVGAALLIPTSLAIVQTVFVREDRGQAVGAWTGLTGVAILIGPFLGGWLVQTFSWRLVFLINPPLTAIAVWITLVKVPERVRPGAPPPDLLGAAMASLGLFGVVYALIQGPGQGWGHPVVVTMAAAGIAGVAAFLVVERRVPHPMLPLDVFRIRQFVGANATTLPVYFALSGVFFLLVLQMLRVLGYSELEAGAAGAPVTVLLLLLSPRAGKWLAPRPRLPMALGPVVAAVGVALLSRAVPGSRYAFDILPGLLVFGVGLAATVTPLTATALGALDESRSGLASGINNAVARIAGLLAIPMLPLLAGIGGLEDVGGTVFSDGFRRAMWVGAAMLVAGGLVAWALVRDPDGDA